MQLVIEIDKDYYEIIKHEVEHGHDFKPYNLIANGIPLPKGHGRLIDADELKQTLQNHHDFFIFAYGSINKFRQLASLSDKVRTDEINTSIAEVLNAPTIIEADGGDNA